MSFSSDLLDQADHLVAKEPNKPKQASLRRAASNAYYALFHFLTWESTTLIAASVTDTMRMQMQRWFDHSSMFAVCGIFSSGRLEGQLEKLIGPKPLPELQQVARTFRQLQQERHTADYDMQSTWTRLRTRQAIQSSRDAIQAWISIRKTPQANLFALALLFDLKKMTDPRK
jgi:uncharacterized protein (UPF0332 family)